MAQGLNKVILIGNLGTDPEVKYTSSNQAIAKFRLATSETFTDRSQKQQERTEWHNIVVWGKTAENVGRYLKKGRQVYIEGRIQYRQWDDKEGKKRYATDVVAQRVMFLGGRGQDGEFSGASQAAPGPSQSPADEGFGEVQDPFPTDFDDGDAAKGGGRGGSKGPGPDDDMPF